MHKILFVPRSKIHYLYLYKLHSDSKTQYLKEWFVNQKAGEVTLKEEDVIVSIVKIDLTRGKKNPLERYVNDTGKQCSWWFDA